MDHQHFMISVVALLERKVIINIFSVYVEIYNYFKQKRKFISNCTEITFPAIAPPLYMWTFSRFLLKTGLDISVFRKNQTIFHAYI